MTPRDNRALTLANNPHYAGVGYGLEDFGNSQYDSYLTSSEDIKNRSLEDLRAERQQSEQRKITEGFITGMIVIGFIIFLIKKVLITN